MLLQHDDIYRLGVFESEEAKTTRTARCSIPHHSALENLAELLKVIL